MTDRAALHHEAHRGAETRDTDPLLSSTDRWIWCAGFLLIAALLVITQFASDDPDSALYAAISDRLSRQPLSMWIAPQWWGQWNSEGLFREHPAGVFLLPAALGALGIPATQAAYIVGIATGLASLLLIGVLVRRATSTVQARAVLVLLQVMPVAFIFRIRANHEYPMLLCLVLMLIGLDNVRRSWLWALLVGVALTFALLVKGVFVVILLAAACAWILTNPTRSSGSVVRPIAAVAFGLAMMTATALMYDAVYLTATGESFWRGYWERQLGPLTIATPVEGGGTLASNLLFYALRLLWHPAPWSIMLILAVWRTRQTSGSWIPNQGLRGGVAFVLLFTAAAVVMLSPASRFAERYLFSATYAIATLGVVVSCATWPALQSALDRADRRLPSLPAMAWILLMLLRLGIGPFLPRITG